MVARKRKLAHRVCFKDTVGYFTGGARQEMRFDLAFQKQRWKVESQVHTLLSHCSMAGLVRHSGFLSWSAYPIGPALSLTLLKCSETQIPRANNVIGSAWVSALFVIQSAVCAKGWGP